MDAVRRHGPGVSVAEIAAAAGITKPVLYRHFTDRADLQRAVGKQAGALLMERIAPELARDREPIEHIRGVIDAFLAGIEEEPELWRFVVHPQERAPGTDVIEDVREQISRLLATLLGERLRGLGLDSGGAEAWAHGLVGMMQSVGDWWLQRRTMSRATLTDYLTTLVWGGVAGVLGGEESRDRVSMVATTTMDTRSDDGQPIANPTRRTSSGAIST